MDSHLKPRLFECDPSSPTAAKQWSHWKKTFSNFSTSLEVKVNKDKKEGEAKEKINFLDIYSSIIYLLMFMISL